MSAGEFRQARELAHDAGLEAAALQAEARVDARLAGTFPPRLVLGQPNHHVCCVTLM